MGLTPEETTKVRIRQVRAYMKDLPEYNRLIPKEEATDEQIRLSLELTVDDYNTSPPQNGTFDISMFPSTYVLVMGSVLQLLQMEGVLQSRNKTTYNVGQITFSVSDKTPEYQNWIVNFRQEYEQKKADLKKFLNADSGYGGVPSEYAGTDFWY